MGVMEKKTHFKMYKSHKGWLVAGITATSLAVGLVVGPQAEQTAQASDAAPATESISEGNDVEQGSSATLRSTTESDASSVPQGTPSGTESVTGDSQAETTDQKTPTDATNQDSKTTTSDNHVVNESSSDQNDQSENPAPVDESINKESTLLNKETESEPVDSAVEESTTTDDVQQAKKINQTSVKSADMVAKQADAKADAQTIDQWMPNKTLQQWVLQALNSPRSSTKPDDVKITSVDQITPEDMQYLTNFSSQNYGTTYIDGKTSFSLEGLQYATNLTHLDLINDIDKDPNALRGDITDLSPLSDLTNLTWLQTGQSRVSDITPISGLKNIKYLFLGIANISDFSSLDPAQYTENFAIQQQFVENKVVYIPTTGKYEMINPVKPPKGMTVTVHDQAGIAIPIIPDNFPNSTIRVFWQGGTGSLSADQSKLEYQATRNQMEPGQTYNPYANIYKNMPQEDFTYWFNSIFDFTGNGKTISSAVAMVTPYRVSIPASPVTVNYVNEQNVPLANSTQLSGLQGEPYEVSAPVIPGYVVTNADTTVTGNFTDMPQSITFTYKSALVNVTQVTEQIKYQDAQGNQVADSAAQQVTFATITDPNTRVDHVYSKVGADTNMTLDKDGQPDASWTLYLDGSTISLAAVANPEIKGMHVIKTTDPANDLTQTVAQNVTNQSENLAFVVTYGHDFDTVLNQVKENITYVDQNGQQVAIPVDKAITFATVTDQTNQQSVVYSHVGDAQAPALDENGTPTDTSWVLYQTGQPIAFEAVVNPTVKGMHVIKTTDSANDLTQTTAQNVTPTSQNLAFVVTYGHDFDTVLNQVKENITYVDQSGQQVATPVDKTITFATVTDQSNQQLVIYSYVGDAQTPGLDENGVPTDANWAVYQVGQPVTFAAVTNPAVKGMHVVKTTDPANDLTQTTAQAVTNASQNLAIVVTYAHDFETTLKHVTENITYVDQNGQQVATPVDKTITFATVTDQSNQKSVIYSNDGEAQAPKLDENGVPTDVSWVVYQDGTQLTFAAVPNPKVAGQHVVKTTDPANDLTQTTAQSITPNSENLTFVVTYAADATTGGGGDNGNNGGDNGGGDIDTGGNGNTVNPEVPEVPDTGNSGGNVVAPGDNGDQAAVKPTKKPSKPGLSNGGNAATAANGGSAATADLVSQSAPAKQQSLGTVTSVSDETTAPAADKLPQTSDQQNKGAAVIGLALLGSLAGLLGLKKRKG
ncbi:mucin-binding protein [Levilactobacillus namurensis]|uniref:MucBP domain-containing protein n=1 Tax=Levilactobacillus namurensis TaxID=380393 RepID=A0AAW8W522_9LACO|nr:MucBP domain-containing protein [Levilactobacillus namurensis]MDT7013965.1 MucBP domain-containing protein [Levilactobacillus namurensis]